MRFLISYFFVALVFAGCTKDVGYVNSGAYPDNIDRIFTRKCATAGCHNTVSAEAANSLDLSSWRQLFKGSGSGSPVIPFSSRFSSLCYFVNTYSDLGAQNIPTMPFNASALSKEEVKTIKQWIDDGAPDATGVVAFSDDDKREKLYAVNQGCDVVTVVDAKTQLPMRFIEVGPGKYTPHQVRVSPDGKFWYVLYLNHNFMKKFSCSDDAFVADIPLTPLAAGTGAQNALDWNTFSITSDGKRAYCVSWTAIGVISCVDLENNKLIHYSPGWTYPHGIHLSADNKKVYIAAQTGNYISEIDSSLDVSTKNDYALDGGQISTATSLDPHDMALSADGNALVITCQKSNEIIVFNLLTKQPSHRIATGYYPQEIVYSQRYRAYYFTCSGNGTGSDAGSVVKLDDTFFKPTLIKHGSQPHGIAVDEKQGLVYVLSRNISSDGPLPHHTSQCAGRNGFVTFLDPITLKPNGKKFELSVDPYFIYPRP
jgi:DNA-binding beta-propeller fold protein YncE